MVTESIPMNLSEGALDAEELQKMDAYWRATLYLCVGMIYLLDNPLLREPLQIEHVKKRLLGHWGSDPGQTFTWLHLNRLIKKHDLKMIFISGPGHGAPSVLANAYLEGTYSEVYPDKSEDEEGLRRFFKQFSFPGGIGSHCTILDGENRPLCHLIFNAYENPLEFELPPLDEGEPQGWYRWLDTNLEAPDDLSP